MKYSNTLEFALEMDANDPLRDMKKEFLNPKTEVGKEAIYFCGNSLGLQPRSARSRVERIMKDWESRAVDGHFKGDEPWVPYHERLAPPMARIVGATLSNTVTESPSTRALAGRNVADWLLSL